MDSPQALAHLLTALQRYFSIPADRVYYHCELDPASMQADDPFKR